MLIFVYGTLMSGLGNNGLLSSSEFIARATTKEKYTLYCRGIPYVSKEPRYPIIGEVWKVSKSTLPSIDSLEGHPNWYKREKIPVVLEDGTEEEAWLYFNDSIISATPREDGDYRKYLDEKVRYSPVQTPIT